jgi:hypothetical protein
MTMVLVATTDLVLAKILNEAIPGEKTCITNHRRKPQHEEISKKTEQRRKKMSAAEIDADDVHQQLRRFVFEEQPAILLLDVRYGGSMFRVVESVPRILDEAKSNPRVILIVPFDSADAEEEAARLGCFDVLVFTPRRKQVFVRELVEALTAAELDRKRRPAAAASRGAPSSRAIH